jgi:hypothetical protein
MVTKRQIEICIRRHGDPRPPEWQRPESAIEIAFRNGNATTEELKQDHKRKEEQAEKEKEQRHQDLIYYLRYKIVCSLGECCTLPRQSLEAFREELKTQTPSSLRQQSESIDYRIERNKEVQSRLKPIFSQQAKEKAERHESVEYFDGHSDRLIALWQYHDEAELAEAQVAVLDEDIRFNMQEKQAVENELASRRNSPKVKENIAKMKELAKRAITIRPIVVQANREAWKALQNGAPSIQIAKTFMDNLEEFHELERQYNCLFTDLQFLTDTANVPVFPSSMTTDEISSKSYVEQVLKRASCGK